MASEIDTQLQPTEQAELLADAATRLGTTESAEKPLRATLTFLEDRGLIGDYTQSPWAADVDGGPRSVVVHLSNYALSARDGSLPVLPIVVELYRHRLDHRPMSLRVVDRGDGWRVRFVLADTAEPDGLTNVSIDTEV